MGVLSPEPGSPCGPSNHPSSDVCVWYPGTPRNTPCTSISELCCAHSLSPFGPQSTAWSWGNHALPKGKKILDSWLQLAILLLQRRWWRRKQFQLLFFVCFFVLWGEFSRSNLGTWVTQFHFTIRNKATWTLIVSATSSYFPNLHSVI